MSRIGRAPIALPAGVTFDNTDNLITVKGPLGTLTQKVDPSIEVVLEDGHILVKRHSDDKDHRALHGLYRALIHNMVTGVTKGFEKNLIVAGVGYKVTATPNKLTLNIGFSHAIDFDAPEGITFAMAGPLEIVVKGIDRQKVGQAAASIKALKPVEPYHGYGIHYKDEVVIRKEGKTAGKVSGTAERPRLNVYRSTNHIYAQIIDDVKGVTLCSASTLEKSIAAKVADMTKTEAAKAVGAAVAEKALAMGIKAVVFDRGGYVYTGRVAALAAGAREGGLEF